ncbi:hypothetical protein ACS5NO_31935 [Larkinella sp. GY13]|uniref:hypothetical protein n=1 Tax=Larkinella sp. GY13 TaxID=3453720 RepID=UPI003EE859AF
MKTSIKHTLAMIAFLASTLVAQAQMKVGDNPTTINPGSLIEMESTNKGLLMPRISLTTTTTWGLAGTPAAGMHVYNTNASITSTNTSYPTLAAKIGEYYWDGTGWVALAPAQRNTVITSFEQSVGGVIDFPTISGTCNVYTAPSVLPCATYLNHTGSFGITNNTNDVVIDLATTYILANNTTTVFFNIVIYVDVTTPGVFQRVGANFITHTGTGCGGSSTLSKAVLKNLPVRSNYTVRVYFAPWVNTGAPAKIAFGDQIVPGCGDVTYTENKLIVSVSQ